MMFNVEKKFISIILVSFSMIFSISARADSCWIDYTEDAVNGINIYFNKDITLFGYLNKPKKDKESLRIEGGKVITNTIDRSSGLFKISSTESNYLFMLEGYSLILYTNYEQCVLETRIENNSLQLYFKQNYISK